MQFKRTKKKNRTERLEDKPSPSTDRIPSNTSENKAFFFVSFFSFGTDDDARIFNIRLSTIYSLHDWKCRNLRRCTWEDSSMAVRAHVSHNVAQQRYSNFFVENKLNRCARWTVNTFARTHAMAHRFIIYAIKVSENKQNERRTSNVEKKICILFGFQQKRLCECVKIGERTVENYNVFFFRFLAVTKCVLSVVIWMYCIHEIALQFIGMKNKTTKNREWVKWQNQLIPRLAHRFVERKTTVTTKK